RPPASEPAAVHHTPPRDRSDRTRRPRGHTRITGRGQPRLAAHSRSEPTEPRTGPGRMLNYIDQTGEPGSAVGAGSLGPLPRTPVVWRREFPGLRNSPGAAGVQTVGVDAPAACRTPDTPAPIGALGGGPRAPGESRGGLASGSLTPSDPCAS